LFGGNGGWPRSIIGNPKYPKSPRGLNGPDPLLFGFDGYPTKTLFTSLGIFVCTLTSYVPLGMWGLDLIPIIIYMG
jgi:hypothetical protein